MERQETIFLNSVFFVLGFTLVFSILGILLQTLLSHISFQAMEAIRIIGGAIILAFGVLLIASTRYIIPFFSQGHGIRFKRTGNSFVSSFLFGLGFAMGWTPCVGAILGSIYALAATSPGVGFLLLLSYSLGLGDTFPGIRRIHIKALRLHEEDKEIPQLLQHSGRPVPCRDRRCWW